MSEHLEPNREYVVGFMFDANADAVLLIRKNRPTWQAGKLNGIGGRIEDGETPDQAMRREFLEETGVSHDAWNRFCTLRDDRGWLVHFYSTTGDVLKAKSLTDEKVVCCGLPALHGSDALPNLRWLIPMALNMKHEKVDHFQIQERGDREDVKQNGSAVKCVDIYHVFPNNSRKCQCNTITRKHMT